MAEADTPLIADNEPAIALADWLAVAGMLYTVPPMSIVPEA